MILRADDETIARAANELRAGGLVILPTETVYGLGADATNAEAVARIFAAKGRPQFNPLIAHVRGLAEAQREARLHPKAQALAEKYWPGPLTIVAPRADTSTVAELACAGLSTIALRAPAHPIARALLDAFEKPIAAPSANISGRVSPTSAKHADAELGQHVAFVLDGGPSAVGLESTIVAIGDNGSATLLRPGAITRAEIEAMTGPLANAAHGEVQAPGMLESHYAPNARLRLGAAAPERDEAFLAFGPDAPPFALNLSPQGDLTEAAAHLYAYLRALDSTGVSVIAVAAIPAIGLGEAINDRLTRAAAPR
ncbi:MAG: L-threonylcarbamoyladenylate synthase [Caulobacterales bacterium]